jgi:hypothetical protein
VATKDRLDITEKMMNYSKRELRRISGLSQAKVAELAKTSRHAVRCFEEADEASARILVKRQTHDLLTIIYDGLRASHVAPQETQSE